MEELENNNVYAKLASKMSKTNNPVTRSVYRNIIWDNLERDLKAKKKGSYTKHTDRGQLPR